MTAIKIEKQQTPERQTITGRCNPSGDQIKALIEAISKSEPTLFDLPDGKTLIDIISFNLQIDVNGLASLEISFK